MIEKSGRLEVVGLEYETVKLFQLSLLWRTGASGLEEFSAVSLGPHEEWLRKMIMKGDPGPREKYGCLLVSCPKYKDVMQRMIISPDTVKLGAHHVVRFLLAGLFWNYFVSSHTPDIASENVFLTEDGVLPILAESKYTGQYIGGLSQRWKASGNVDEVLEKFGD